MQKTLSGRVTLTLFGATLLTTIFVLVIETMIHANRASTPGGEAERFMLWAILATQVVVFAGVGLVFKRLLIRPAQILLRSMRQVAEGDLGARVILESPREFAELGSQFNVMVERLDAANKEVETCYAAEMARVDRLATVGEMTAALSHEIRNPLAGLGGALQVLHKESRSEEHREIIAEMRSTLRRLAETTDELLTYGRTPSASVADHDVNRCIRSVLSFVTLQLSADPLVTVDSALRDGLPPVRVDSLQLQQALLNVVLNAIQAMPEGGTLSVATARAASTYPGRERVVIEVVDTGVGVDELDLPKIFEPFHTTRAEGTGLGLGISRRIIESFGGRLELSSVYGEGTTVRIWLPAQLIGAADQGGAP